MLDRRKLIDAMAAAGAQRTWADLCPVGDVSRAWDKCPSEAQDRWRGVAEAMLDRVLGVLTATLHDGSDDKR
jgi:hypothetical protein